MKRVPKWAAIAALILVGTGIAYAGLETVTHIQDLNAAWPLGSDLASTSDDHIRNIKSALKTDFPNFNGTYTSASLPVFAIPSDTNTGMYSVAADDLGFSTGGTLRFDVSTTAFIGTLPWRGQDGTVGAPALSFSGDTDTGLYRPGANAIDVALGGAVGIQFRTATIGITDGALGAPGLSFINDSDTGIYRNGANDMRIVAGGVIGISVFANGAEFRAQDGTAASPTIYFQSDNDTGFYHDTANQLGITLGGATAGQIAQGTFTGTITGVSSGGTGTVTYQRFGKLVYLTATAGVTGVSNTTAMTMTGIPAIIQPAGTPLAVCSRTVNGSGLQNPTDCQISGGTMTFCAYTGTTSCSTNGWLGSGNKGVPTGWTAVYSVD
jgi:hypothetical protein